MGAVQAALSQSTMFKCSYSSRCSALCLCNGRDQFMCIFYVQSITLRILVFVCRPPVRDMRTPESSAASNCQWQSLLDQIGPDIPSDHTSRVYSLIKALRNIQKNQGIFHIIMIIYHFIIFIRDAYSV